MKLITLSIFIGFFRILGIVLIDKAFPLLKKEGKVWKNMFFFLFLYAYTLFFGYLSDILTSNFFNPNDLWLFIYFAYFLSLLLAKNKTD